MTTRRPYHEAMSIDEALAELARCSGSQFDPAVVAPLVAIVRAEGDRTSPAEAHGPQDRTSLLHG
jgi:HD-GYP domain-containing protein (c-di-GMP phosphodiesterase class II)